MNSVTLDTQFGDGAKASLEKLLGEEVDEFQDGSCRIVWEDGAQLELAYPHGKRFVFCNYTGRGLLNRLPGPFGTWGEEFKVKRMEAIFADIDSRRAFEQIGFKLEDERTGLMAVTPKRLSAYHSWKHKKGKEPSWHRKAIPH